MINQRDHWHTLTTFIIILIDGEGSRRVLAKQLLVLIMMLYISVICNAHEEEEHSGLVVFLSGKYK